jgi:hypothetical protein
LANVSKFKPPTSADPSPLTPKKTVVLAVVFAENKWPIKTEYVDKAVIVEDVDRWCK